mgnify:FL=1
MSTEKQNEGRVIPVETVNPDGTENTEPAFDVVIIFSKAAFGVEAEI